ncbi:hypothetical protein Plec18167_004963 [Paecilomyces lecythidis]|uniref:Pyroglutamyl peptidase type I n=1 Tax=Paecilomyces lecythidis TaxID=3004212 RepID=A0ABR3XNJ6_9EURO
MGDYGPATSPTATTLPDGVPAIPTVTEDISVLVTGFGPFKTHNVNSSWLVASSLPSMLVLPGKASSVTPEGGPAARQISIHTHPSPVPVSYSAVRSNVPEIVDEYARVHNGRRPDLIIHIGLASTRNYWSVETLARRDDYRMGDVDGKVGYESGEKIWKEQGLPPLLRPGPADGRSLSRPATTMSTVVAPAITSTAPLVAPASRVSPYPVDDHFLEVWKSFAPAGSDIRISHDAGRYLCEFIFYTSLAQALQEGRDRSVVFFHVPSWHDEANIKIGTEIAVALIKALVTCWMDDRQT